MSHRPRINMRVARRLPLAARVIGAMVAPLWLALVGCGGGGSPFAPGKAAASDADAEEQATPIVVAVVEAGTITASISAASTIEAERQVTVHAESTGRLEKLTVEEGDHVREGAVIGRIKYDAQAAMLDRAATSLEKTKRDLETVRALHSRGVASKEELDAAELAHQQALLDLRDSRRDVRNTRVVVPFSGTVAERFVNEGAFVASGAQILSIVDMKTLVARVYVPEKELDRIREGQPALIVGKAAQGRQGMGFIKRIAPVVDPTTGTVKVTIALPEALVETRGGFVPGMYAEVTLTTAQRDRAALVPKEAIVHDDDQAFVFVVDGDRARRTVVEIGLRDATHAEVLSGVALGTEVVSSGHAGLKDGALVRRVEPTGSPAEEAAPETVGVSSVRRHASGANDDSAPADHDQSLRTPEGA